MESFEFFMYYYNVSDTNVNRLDSIKGEEFPFIINISDIAV